MQWLSPALLVFPDQPYGWQKFKAEAVRQESVDWLQLPPWEVSRSVLTYQQRAGHNDLFPKLNLQSSIKKNILIFRAQALYIVQ